MGSVFSRGKQDPEKNQKKRTLEETFDRPNNIDYVSPHGPLEPSREAPIFEEVKEGDGGIQGLPAMATFADDDGDTADEFIDVSPSNQIRRFQSPASPLPPPSKQSKNNSSSSSSSSSSSKSSSSKSSSSSSSSSSSNSSNSASSRASQGKKGKKNR
eukprot:TRINITY_DN2030_c0_g1_i6.p1 TRINITY_DN2030_c0_g1~~TRINITY_DN2030_c0_g1_i6.p1  ORF type:complete len:157 (-),score=35.83 TRINITY_DN2030_c0_g1_i6:493-963(-)